MTDISSVQIAAGLAGSLTVGTLIFLILQNVKAFAPNLNGRAAESVVVAVAALVALAAFITTDADWYDPETIIAYIVSTLSASVLARSTYAALYKQSVPNLPPPSDERIISVETASADDPHANDPRAPITPAVMAAITQDSTTTGRTRGRKGTT